MYVDAHLNCIWNRLAKNALEAIETLPTPVDVLTKRPVRVSKAYLALQKALSVHH
jgi:hypothetical protein